LYLKTAESYLHLNRTTTDESLRTRCKANAGKALERAEKIKMKKKDLAPAVLDPFSIGVPLLLFSGGKTANFIIMRMTEQQFYVLKHSSRVNNLYYSLWDEPPPPESHSVSVFE
jgi:calpain-7